MQSALQPYIAFMFLRDTRPIFTWSTPATAACTAHFDRRKWLFFMSSVSG